MPEGITVKIEGLAEIERAMNRLDERLAKKGAVEAAFGFDISPHRAHHRAVLEGG